MDVAVVKLAGLPMHALVVHVAVILVPLSAVGFIVTGWRAEWRRAYLLPVLLLAFTGAVAAFVATSSGQELENAVSSAARAAGTRARFGDHPEQGDLARNIAVLFALAAAGLWSVERWGQQLALPGWTTTAAYGVASCIGLFAIVTMVIAGHSGAALVWKDVGNFVGVQR